MRHYAGPVQYQTWGFVDKNSEQVAEEYHQLLSDSSVSHKPTMHDTIYVVSVFCARIGVFDG